MHVDLRNTGLTTAAVCPLTVVYFAASWQKLCWHTNLHGPVDDASFRDLMKVRGMRPVKGLTERSFQTFSFTTLILL